MQSTQATMFSDYFVLDLGQPYPCLSSAAIGGGQSRRRWVYSRSVDLQWQSPDPVAETEQAMREAGIVLDEAVGLITAVRSRHLRTAEAQQGAATVRVFATAGVGNASRAGEPCVAVAASTINIVLLVDQALSWAAMVGAVQTAAEAKAAVLQALAVKTATGAQATGTSTDTITVFCAQEGPVQHYAGPATDVGLAIGQAVVSVVQSALQATQS